MGQIYVFKDFKTCLSILKKLYKVLISPKQDSFRRNLVFIGLEYGLLEICFMFKHSHINFTEREIFLI